MWQNRHDRTFHLDHFRDSVVWFRFIKKKQCNIDLEGAVISIWNKKKSKLTSNIYRSDINKLYLLFKQKK